MRIKYVLTAVQLLSAEILRSRIVLLLLFLIPAIFYTVAWVTLSGDPLLFILASVREKPVIPVVQEELGLIFIGLAAAGLISSFLAMTIMQRNLHAKKRIVLCCGYRTSELSLATLLIVLLAMILVGSFVALLSLLFMKPDHLAGVIYGYIVIGFVYGSYGLLVGSVLRRELEGILFIVLLANLDVGWLQNPIYYAAAQSKAMIEYLPAFYPSQATIIAAFTDHSFLPPGLMGVAYGAVFLLLSLVLFRFRIRITR